MMMRVFSGALTRDNLRNIFSTLQIVMWRSMWQKWCRTVCGFLANTNPTDGSAGVRNSHGCISLRFIHYKNSLLISEFLLFFFSIFFTNEKLPTRHSSQSPVTQKRHCNKTPDFKSHDAKQSYKSSMKSFCFGVPNLTNSTLFTICPHWRKR